MFKTRFISMLVLLAAVVTGAMAQTTYKVSVKEGTEDATNWQGKAGEGEYQALPLEGVAANTAVTVKYSGAKKVKSVKAVKKAASLIVNPVVGQIIGSDGKNYDANATLPAGTTAVAMIAYVGSSTGDATYNHGLALALTDESSSCIDWYNAMTACTNKNTSATVNSASWMLPSRDQWDTMISAAGSYTSLRDGFTSVGGSNLQSTVYWSSTEVEGSPSDAWMFFFDNGSWYDYPKNNDSEVRVRACLAF